MKRIFLFAVAIPMLIYAGWTRTYGGNFDAVGYCIEQTTDGGYIITGEKYMWYKPSYELWLIKTDSSGDTLWTRSYFENESLNHGYCVQQTLDEGYIIVGETNDTLAEGTELLLMKTDSIGSLEWRHKYNGGEEDLGFCVRQTRDTGFIISGGSDFDRWILKTDSLGNEIWSRKYAEDGCGWAECIEQTSDDGYIVFSFGDSLTSDDDYVLSMLKLNENGDSLWMKFTEGSVGGLDPRPRTGQQTLDGGFVVVGNRNDSLWLLKTDSVGENEWERTYPIDVDGKAVIELEDGSYTIAGNIHALSPEDRHAYFLKVDNLGDTLWSKTYGRDGGDHVCCMDRTNDGGFISVGYAHNLESQDLEVYVIKIDSTGDTLTAISELLPTPSPTFELLTSIGPQVILRFAQSETRSQLSVFDASGRKVDELGTPLRGGVVSWGEEHNPGVYFIVADIDGDRQAEKVILVR